MIEGKHHCDEAQSSCEEAAYHRGAPEDESTHEPDGQFPTPQAASGVRAETSNVVLPEAIEADPQQISQHLAWGFGRPQLLC
jgi:hypothetical protein